MAWIAVLSWVSAVIFALVVLGFCTYEVFWKASRLSGDVKRLRGLSVRLLQLQASFTATAQRGAGLSPPADHTSNSTG